MTAGRRPVYQSEAAVRRREHEAVGVTHVTVTIRNPADPSRSWQGPFLVDTGAIDSLVPRTHLEAIGLKPAAQRVYETADGRQITMDVTI